MLLIGLVVAWLSRTPPPVGVEVLPRAPQQDVVEVSLFRSRPRAVQILEGECRVRDGAMSGSFDVQLVFKAKNAIALCPFTNEDENEGACEHRQRFTLTCKSPALVRVGRATRRIEQTLRFELRGKGLGVVATVALEHYVDAVVRVEHPRAPFEAQRAQAIVARSFALHAALEPRHRLAPLCATQHCQVYKGAFEDIGMSGPSATHASARMVLVDDDGAIPPTFFHSTCGGRTLDAERVWPGAGASSITGVDDVDEDGRAWCRGSRYFRWSHQASDVALAAALSDAVGRSLDPKSLSAHPSADGLSLRIGDAAGIKRVRGAKVHRVLGRRLGWDQVLSPRFTMTRSGSNIRLSGSGLGHGVGMCQRGAEARAEAGQSAEEILRAYFPNLKLGTLDSRTER